MQVFLAASIIGCIIGAPSLLVWGWVRWAQRPQPRSFFPILSLAGFLFATAFGLLAVSSFTYSLAVGGLPYYDPRLLSIFRWGFLLSLAGLALGIGRVWRPSSLRWHSPPALSEP
jgi:hypothetical protein